MEQLFETATRNKYRFETKAGLVTVEDLWDLPLSSRTNMDLDTVAKAINKKLKESDEESFVSANTRTNLVLQTKLDLVKHIIKVKLDEADAKKQSAEKAERRQKLIDALERKDDQNLLNMSVDEIKIELAKV